MSDQLPVGTDHGITLGHGVFFAQGVAGLEGTFEESARKVCPFIAEWDLVQRPKVRAVDSGLSA